MKRRLFSILSALSLLLFVAAIVARVHPVNVKGPPIWFSQSWATEIATGDYDKDPDWGSGCDPQWHSFLQSMGGYLVTWHEPGETKRRWAIRVPEDVTVPELLILPALWTLIVLRRHHQRCRRQKSIEQGLCLTCGYNLTGNVSGICPECGQPIPQTQKNFLPPMGHR